MQIKELKKQQTPSEFRLKKLWHAKEILENSLRAANFLPDKNWQLIVYGSLLNSICTKDLSDLDITIVVYGYVDQADVLFKLQDVLETKKCYEKIQRFVLPSGPLLQLTDTETDIDIDISVNKLLEIQNSQLICSYAKLDRRFANLAVVLKIWNKSLFSNKITRLNSYTLNLMLIAFMQHLKLLPSLQARSTCPQEVAYDHQGKHFWFSATANVAFESNLSKIVLPESTMSEATIILRFFKFYGFEFDH